MKSLRANQGKSEKLNICIIGYGRFGRLLARMLAPYGQVHIISPRRERGVRQIELAELDAMDLVIPAVPISVLESVIAGIAPCLKPDALVMDVASVKVLPCRWLKKHLPRTVDIIGSHPMFGPDSARHGLKRLVLALCPLRIAPANYRRIRRIFGSLGLKLLETTPEQHDREAARSLSLVHFIGRGLELLAIKPQAISTVGYERLLRVNETVTNDTWQLFLDMHRFNPYARKVRKDLMRALARLDRQLL